MTAFNWHEKHMAERDPKQLWADKVTGAMGSWKFIGWQTGLVVVWVLWNIIGIPLALMYHFDPYPFILLNLFFSTQASYASPLILMAGNRAGERDRANAEHDYQVNRDAEREIQELKAMVRELIDKNHQPNVG
jgi:uncharacterized membrane protein